MKVHHWEKAFLAAGATVLAVFGASLFYISFGADIHLPGAHGRILPQDVPTTPPFDQPGVRPLPDGRVEAVVIGRAWSFEPAEIRVPAETEILFTATTTDVIHGFHVEATRLNMMLIPGQISHNTYTFSEPGEHLLICHEYCGIGHHVMAGHIIVEPRESFAFDAEQSAWEGELNAVGAAAVRRWTAERASPPKAEKHEAAPARTSPEIFVDVTAHAAQGRPLLSVAADRPQEGPAMHGEKSQANVAMGWSGASGVTAAEAGVTPSLRKEVR